MPSTTTTLLQETRDRLAASGLNLCGVASVADFDACQCRERRIATHFPEGRSVLVIASGGRQFWERMLQRHGPVGPAAPNYHPIDEHGAALIEEERQRLAESGLAGGVLLPFGEHTVDFVALGELAGLGHRSPVVPLLLHPVFGPWISMRGAIVLEEELDPTGPMEGFAPCSECHAPCLSSCPTQAVQEPGAKEDAKCAEHRSRGGCQHGCDVRAACVYGTEHAYGGEERAFRNSYVRFELERWFGLGRWRFVPKFLRRR